NIPSNRLRFCNFTFFDGNVFGNGLFDQRLHHFRLYSLNFSGSFNHRFFIRIIKQFKTFFVKLYNFLMVIREQTFDIFIRKNILAKLTEIDFVLYFTEEAVKLIVFIRTGFFQQGIQILNFRIFIE
ncbi:hypothetical protein ADUPG1_003799, partial [Aduncisulcus paluster]